MLKRALSRKPSGGEDKVYSDSVVHNTSSFPTPAQRLIESLTEEVVAARQQIEHLQRESDGSAAALQRLQRERETGLAAQQQELEAAHHTVQSAEQRTRQAEAETERWRRLAASLQVQGTDGAAAAARSYLEQVEHLERQLASKTAEAERWEAQARAERAMRAEEAQRGQHVRAELARLRREVQEAEGQRQKAAAAKARSQSSQLAAARVEAEGHAQRAQQLQSALATAETELAQRALEAQQLERIRQKNLQRILELKQALAMSTTSSATVQQQPPATPLSPSPSSGSNASQPASTHPSQLPGPAAGLEPPSAMGPAPAPGLLPGQQQQRGNAVAAGRVTMLGEVQQQQWPAGEPVEPATPLPPAEAMEGSRRPSAEGHALVAASAVPAPTAAVRQLQAPGQWQQLQQQQVGAAGGELTLVVSQLQTELAATQEHARELEGELATAQELSRGLATQLAAAQELSRGLEEQLAAAEEHGQGLEEQLAASQERSEALQEGFTAAVQRLQQVEGWAGKLAGELAAMRQVQGQAMQRAGLVERELLEAQREAQEARQEAQQAQREAQEAAQRTVAALAEAAGLRLELEGAGREGEEAAAREEGLVRQLEAAAAELAVARRREDGLRSQVDMLSLLAAAAREAGQQGLEGKGLPEGGKALRGAAQQAQGARGIYGQVGSFPANLIKELEETLGRRQVQQQLHLGPGQGPAQQVADGGNGVEASGQVQPALAPGGSPPGSPLVQLRQPSSVGGLPQLPQEKASLEGSTPASPGPSDASRGGVEGQQLLFGEAEEGEGVSLEVPGRGLRRVGPGGVGEDEGQGGGVATPEKADPRRPSNSAQAAPSEDRPHQQEHQLRQQEEPRVTSAAASRGLGLSQGTHRSLPVHSQPTQHAQQGITADQGSSSAMPDILAAPGAAASRGPASSAHALASQGAAGTPRARQGRPLAAAAGAHQQSAPLPTEAELQQLRREVDVREREVGRLLEYIDAQLKGGSGSRPPPLPHTEVPSLATLQAKLESEMLSRRQLVKAYADLQAQVKGKTVELDSAVSQLRRAQAAKQAEQARAGAATKEAARARTQVKAAAAELAACQDELAAVHAALLTERVFAVLRRGA